MKFLLCIWYEIKATEKFGKAWWKKTPEYVQNGICFLLLYIDIYMYM